MLACAPMANVRRGLNDACGANSGQSELYLCPGPWKQGVWHAESDEYDLYHVKFGKNEAQASWGLPFMHALVAC